MEPMRRRWAWCCRTSPGSRLCGGCLVTSAGSHYYGGTSTVVSTYIAYPRHRLARFGPDLIHTRRGVGHSPRLPRANDLEDPDER